MKNKLLALVSLVFLLSTFGGKAQQNISLSFNSTSNLDSVKIENLNNASSKVLKGSYNIVLQLDAPNLIESIDMFSEPLVYPNPFTQQVNFEFLTAYQNKVNLAVYDLSGKVVAQLDQNIDLGSHRFTFRPSKPGVYLMKVSDKSKVYNAKIICTEGNSTYSIIEYVGLVSTQTTKPSKVIAKVSNTSSDLTAKSGDMLRFTGYSSSNINSIYDLANSTKNYTFTFSDRYFKFKNYNIQASKPSFVDVMFSVTDINNKGVDYLSNSDFSVLEDNVTTSPTETFRFVRKMQQIPSKIKTVLLLDNSTSVSSDIETIKNAAIKFIQSIRNEQEIAIYAFSDTPVLLQNFTANKTLLQDAIKSINSGFPSTNLYGSTITALSQWTDTYTLSGIVQGSLIVFTDGSDTQGSSTLSAVITSRGDKKIYVIGLGSEINPTALNQIANPGPYYPIQKTSELDAVFATIQSDIVQFSNSFYWLNYLSPKRTGTHTLKVSATSNTNTTATSYLTGSFSAVGFSSVLSGTYVNIEDTRLYGLDTIRCFYSSAGYSFTYDANNLNQYSKDSLTLKPVTYWASKPPVYSWAIGKTNIYQTTLTAYSYLSLKPIVTKSDTSIIILKDEANNYTKKLTLIINPVFAELTTMNPKNITYSSVTLGGEITNIGSGAVTERGICYSTTTNPTIANTKVAIGFGKGSFESTIKGITPNTTYYIKSYATNSAGTSYGTELSFKTLSMPVLTTSNITNITSSTVNCGGNITSDGGDVIIARGVCWSTTSNPTITNNKTVDGNGIGIFSSSITGLAIGTTYYVRSYATNNGGTTYGNQISFTITLPGVSTTSVTSIMAATAIGGGNVINNGTTQITSRGICYSTTTAIPTTSDNLIIDTQTGFGSFVSNLKNLKANTTYYVRAFATNSIGTAYGSAISFTSQSGIITTNTTTISSILALSATSGGDITADGGSPVTSRGVCWSTNPAPTIALSTKTVDGNGIGSFTSSMTGLMAGTKYYVRSYATNTVGTKYGNEISFTTQSGVITINTTSITGIAGNSAASGGNITDEGGSIVISRGLCWSTSTAPTVTLDTKTVDGAGIGVFTSRISNLVNGTKYYVRSYATNGAGTSYGNEISFVSTIASVGDTYCGGIVFYVDGTGQHGLVCAPSDQSTGIKWNNGSYTPTGAIATDVGTGNANSIAIVATQGAGNYAAKLCVDLVLNTYSDWYLPSKDELNLMYLFLKKKGLGSFAGASNSIYWSSSQNGQSSGNAWFQNFSDGYQSSISINFQQCTDLKQYVRSIRTF